MPELLAPDTHNLAPPLSTTSSTQPQPYAKTLREEAARRLSRSPHPYHRLKAELPHPSERLVASASSSSLRSTTAHDDQDSEEGERRTGFRGQYKDSTGTSSDSGTEADDEHFLKGLPAPKLRSHKGLRGEDVTPSSSPSPRLSPTEHSFSSARGTVTPRRREASVAPETEDERIATIEKLRQRRRIECVRRCGEAGLLVVAFGLTCLHPGVRQLLWFWKKGTVTRNRRLKRKTNIARNFLPMRHNDCSAYPIPSSPTATYPSFGSMGRAIFDSFTRLFRSCAFTIPTALDVHRQFASCHGKMAELTTVYNTGDSVAPAALDSVHWWSAWLKYLAVVSVVFSAVRS